MTDFRSLVVGVDAPDLEMEDADGVVHRLRDYIGVKNVVLAFYPKNLRVAERRRFARSGMSRAN